MFSELLQNVSEQYAKNLPFVVYKKPNEVIVKAIFQENSDVHYIKDFSETGFVFAPFDSNQSSILLPKNVLMKAEYRPKKILAGKVGISTANEVSEKEIHLNLVKKGIAKIRQGKFKKAVLSRKMETTYKASPIDVFCKLLDTYANAFCYLWHHPKVGTWLGATPEILLKTENQRFTTMSLAGTHKYVANKIPEWGNKELEEQQLVTDYISNVLQGSVSNLDVDDRESIRAGDLWHLRTKLKGSIEKESLAKIIKALHPTPAVCGLPMKIAKDFILANENYDREYYTGFLGELNFKSNKARTSNSRNQENKAYRSIKNTTTLFVNLRCMQLKASNAHIYMGGGVTKDSDPEKEWLETVAKSKTMLNVLTAD